MNQASSICQTSKPISASDKNQRLHYLDVCRAVVIALVVIFHAHPTSAGIIGWFAWFRMPSFFILSGLLYKQPQQQDLWRFVKKRTSNLLVPYFAYGFLFIIVLSNFNLLDKIFITYPQLKATFLLFYGGRAMKGDPFLVFWFINCLYLSLMLFTLIRMRAKNELQVIGTIAAFYVAGMAMNHFIRFSLPWNINVAFIALTYFAIGFYSQRFINSINQDFRKYLPLLGILLAFCCTLFYLSDIGLFQLQVDMRASKISDPLLNILVPPIFTLTILMLAMLLSRTALQPFLSYVGQNTLPILYLHIMINTLVYLVTGQRVPFLPYIALGIIGPLLCAYLLNKTELTRQLFLGRNSSRLLGHARRAYNSIARPGAL
ncbi:acyltransferase family protein [Pontibacter sp. SGAir0037]|uniref:acyltransferase family protein n=1 Tax=Pontibacter sp. SGAir0037 TaxID=2571030 RepID=UPI0010CD339A|nr:acyltransferase family protein [Pontibacter sp. SGAir0037]QCR24117.1 hypothetical protein C1N53_18305 [Pontibacter sp. SGAir0037]